MARRSKIVSPAPPSLPDPIPARKSRRLGLYAPYVLLLAGVAVWSLFWVIARNQASSRLDAAAQQLRAAGYEASWSERTVGGYPFRLDVTLTDARLRDPSGWEIETPRLEAEAYMHALGHWVMAAPQGLSFARPRGGVVNVRGKLIQASLSQLDKTPPKFSFFGRKLVFAPAAGAQPFALSSADKVEMHLLSGPNDQGAVLLRVDDGKAGPSGLFARVAGDRPISLIWDSTLTKMSAFKGPGWTNAARAWSQAGGQINVRQAGVTAGDALIGVEPATLGVGFDGRLKGALDVSLKQAPRAFTALGQDGTLPPDVAAAAAAVAGVRQGNGDVARAVLSFEAGRTTFGPVAIGPAPRAF